MDDETEQSTHPMETDEEQCNMKDKTANKKENKTYDDDFVWEDYLEQSQTEAVPPTAFLHVEKSLESGMEENQLVEVIHHLDGSNPAGYWVAKIVTICGPLLRLRYITPPPVSVEIWKEISSGCLHQLGWCDQHNIPLSLPQDVLKEMQDDTCITDAKNAIDVAKSHSTSVPEEALDGDGYTAVDRIKMGMKVDIIYEEDPYCGWVATVLDNVGGRLWLQYDTPDCAGESFWLFYQHHRLRPIEWIHRQGLPWKYKPPTSSVSYEDEEWAAFLEMSRDDARHLPLPLSLLMPVSEPKNHSFEVGMFLETVHPTKPYSFEFGGITKVIDEKYFQLTVHLKGDEVINRITSLNDPLILPVGFCKENGLTLNPPGFWYGDGEFDIEVYTAVSDLVRTKREMLKKHESAESLGFEVGQRLECVHPVNAEQICIATIKNICEHILVVEIDSETEPLQIIRPCTSQHLFPMGWCQANGYQLQLPARYCSKLKRTETVSEEEAQIVKSENSASADTASTSGSQLSMWCPRLYINHCCFTGPYLSKSKVAKQSQSIGPGSVELVLREVLAMTINAAYIPTRALRELERHVCENQNIPPSWHPMVFKAKFRRYSTTASIPLATTANEVSDFLNLMCQVLQCCPNLWSTKSTGENCPFLCTGNMLTQANPTTYFRGRGRIATSRGGRGGLIYRRKRGGRKRLFVPIRANRLLQPKSLAVPSYDASEDIEDDDECEVEDPEEEENISGSEECLSNFREEPPKRRRTEYPDSSPGLEPAAVTSDPLHWTVKDVELYVSSQPAISHHAVRLREQEVDGRAFLLLNLPTLVQNLGLPHSSAVSLAQHICRVKLAHFIYYRGDA